MSVIVNHQSVVNILPLKGLEIFVKTGDMINFYDPRDINLLVNVSTFSAGTHVEVIDTFLRDERVSGSVVGKNAYQVIAKSAGSSDVTYTSTSEPITFTLTVVDDLHTFSLRRKSYFKLTDLVGAGVDGSDRIGEGAYTHEEVTSDEYHELPGLALVAGKYVELKPWSIVSLDQIRGKTVFIPQDESFGIRVPFSEDWERITEADRKLHVSTGSLFNKGDELNHPQLLFRITPLKVGAYPLGFANGYLSPLVKDEYYIGVVVGQADESKVVTCGEERDAVWHKKDDAVNGKKCC